MPDPKRERQRQNREAARAAQLEAARQQKKRQSLIRGTVGFVLIIGLFVLFAALHSSGGKKSNAGSASTTTTTGGPTTTTTVNPAVAAVQCNDTKPPDNPNRPKFKGKTRLDGTAEENKAIVAGTTASFGTWSVDEASKALIVRYAGNLFPNDEGNESRRPIAITGDELKYANPNPGSGGRSESVYRRAK